jgi:hypothetical protein
MRMKFGNVSVYKPVREKAWDWMMRGPMKSMWEPHGHTRDARQNQSTRAAWTISASGYTEERSRNRSERKVTTHPDGDTELRKTITNIMARMLQRTACWNSKV